MDQETLVERLSARTDYIELSVRSYNCLKAANIETLGELVQHDERALLRTFGRNSLAEIKEVLADKELYFGMPLPEEVLALFPIRNRHEVKLYPEPLVPLAAHDWNAALKTRYGERIVELLAPFQTQPLALMPPIEDLEERVQRALGALGRQDPVWIVSVSQRREEVIVKEREYQQERARWIQNGRKGLSPWRAYVNIGPEAYLQGGYSLLGWHRLPRSRPLKELDVRERKRGSLSSRDWIWFLVHIYYLLKRRDKVWHRLQESFQTFRGGKLGCSIQLQTIRLVVLETIICEMGLIADGAFDKAAHVDPFVQLARSGNVPFGLVNRTTANPPRNKDVALLVFVV